MKLKIKVAGDNSYCWKEIFIGNIFRKFTKIVPRYLKLFPNVWCFSVSTSIYNLFKKSETKSMPFHNNTRNRSQALVEHY